MSGLGGVIFAAFRKRGRARPSGTAAGYRAARRGKDFAVAACVIVLLQAGQYTQYISNLFLTAVPTTIG